MPKTDNIITQTNINKCACLIVELDVYYIERFIMGVETKDSQAQVK